MALPLLPPRQAFVFTIPGAPFTKKNSQRIAKKADGTPFIVQSSHSEGWEKTAALHLRSQWHRPGGINQPVLMMAAVFRQRNVGDRLNYWAAVSDALEKSGILTNDKWIHSVDGSRCFVDAANPRVEVTIVTLADD